MDKVTEIKDASTLLQNQTMRQLYTQRYEWRQPWEPQSLFMALFFMGTMRLMRGSVKLIIDLTSLMVAHIMPVVDLGCSLILELSFCMEHA
jgi:hypothetical protein